MQENIWSVLGIEPTEDERAIKRAYATKVKIHSPEADPAGYMKLRAAYEQAKSHARYQQELAEQEPAHEAYSGESPALPEIDSGPMPPESAAPAAPAATPQRLAIGDLQALLSRGELEKFLARLEDPASGRVMTLTADQPGVQFYTGNFLDGTHKGKGATYVQYAGLCLETQKFPNAINVPAWQDQVILRPGQPYRHVMVHAFSTAP